MVKPPTNSKLLQVFQFFQVRSGDFGQPQQEVAAVAYKPTLVEMVAANNASSH
jgi:hypothetical protein